MTHRMDAERAYGEPTGVFVRLPFLGTERDRILKEAEVDPDRVEEAILAVGTAALGGELDVVGWGLYSVGGGKLSLFTNEAMAERWAKHFGRTLHPVVRQTDALAKIAEKDAEIAQLRNLLVRLRDAVSRGLTQSQTLPGEKYPIGSQHHPVWVEIASALEVPEDSHD